MTTPGTTGSTTTSPPESSTTTTVPPYSFDGSVPAPELVNTGEDFDAIYRSLDAYDFWLDAHNPDPTLVENFTVKGSAQYDTQIQDVNEQRHSRATRCRP